MNANFPGKWPDMTRLMRDSATLEESLSMYQNRDGDSNAVSFEVPGSHTNVASNVYSSYTAQSMDSIAADPSEQDTDDEDDDEILSWVAKGMLPANMETTLALNQAYQEILEQCCRRVESILVQVRERHRAIQVIIDKKCNTTAKNQTAKVPASLYIYPYFRDQALMCPPMNEETKRKIDEMEDFNFLSEPPSKWSKSERQTLTKAVKSNIMQQKARPMLNKQELLKEKLSLSTNKAKIKEFGQQMIKLDKEHANLMKSKMHEVSSNDDFSNVDWNEISVSDFDGTRTATECRLMWLNELSPCLNQNATWSKDELKKLKRLAVSNSGRHWDEIALKLDTGRSAFQCAEKYQSEFNDALTKRGWTAEDDAMLIDGVDKVRQGDYIPWDQVLLFVEGRTRLQCQSRWFRSVNPALNHGRWKDSEDHCLMEAIDRHGVKDWAKISQIVGTRSDAQCRERWCTALDVNIKQERWSARDDATLLVGVNTFGVGNWSKIRELLPGRTGGMCKVRYRYLKSKNAATFAKIQLDNDMSPENRATVCRRAIQKERKDRVRRQFLNEHGRLPPSPTLQKDVSAFIKSLPTEIQNVVSQKMISVQATYGVVSFRQDAQNAKAKAIAAEASSKIKIKDLPSIPLNTNHTFGKLMDPTSHDQERLKKVDKEIMTLLSNSTWPTVCAYPFARHHSKEESMRKTLIDCISDKKILPPTKSTLLGFKGLLLERQDLFNNCQQLNTIDPLVKTSDTILSNYFDDKEKLQNNGSVEDKDKTLNDSSQRKISNSIQNELVPTQVAYSMINNPSFKLAESIFRSIFLWPAIMSSVEETKLSPTANNSVKND